MGNAALSLETDWAVVDCCSCGCLFAVPAGVHRRWRDDSRIWFFCPNGHRQHYTEGEIQRLRKLQENAEHRVRMAEKREQWAKEIARRAEYRRRAIKGQLTKARKRIANGVCPCCNRTFQNVRRHMQRKHPDFLAEVDGHET